MPQIDDPFRPADATVLRPRPGAGRPGAGVPPPLPRWQMPSAPAAEPLPATGRENLGTGLDPLVRAASNVLLLAGQLRGTLAAPDVAGLRRHALDEIYKFEERARSSGAANETVLAARYALCATLDEAVLSTPWGAQSEWAQQTLLVSLHREAWGGEKFYAMLERISQDPERHIALMELQYLCLVVGFTGKYHVEARGALSVEDQQGRTLITLLAPNLFPSGSATLNGDVVPLVRLVAQAIERVPGRVLVVGHTDDQPVRSLRYRDNFDLSRERAVSVARVLQPAIANPARVEWTGVGSSQPRFRPESDPDNRARNRRVEIVHVR